MTRLDPDGQPSTRPGGGPGDAGGPRELTRRLAASPTVWRGAVAAVGLVALLTARTGVTGLFDEIVGLTMVAIALVEHVPRFFGGHRVSWWRSAVTALTGAVVVAWPSETAQSIGILAAVAIAAYGVTKSVQAFSSAARERRQDRLARGTLTIALAIVVAVFPEATVRIVIVGAGLLWIFRGALVAAAIGRADASSVGPSDAGHRGRG
ncbi:MAG TPA: DUF308 domain-containing protein [Euzebyales bacterium]|nr:DUF308 domain-containing protein [Euzebyales bacterium]